MEFGHFQKDFGVDTSQLKLRIESLGLELASRLKAAVQDNPTGEVDLYSTLQQCTRVAKELDLYRSRYAQHPMSRYLTVNSQMDWIYSIGFSFARLQHLINPLHSAWDVRMTSSCRQHLHIHSDLRGCGQQKRAAMNHVRYLLLENLIYYLSHQWSVKADLEMVLTSNSTTESFHVLLLNANWTAELSVAEAVEGPDGAIYARSNNFFATNSLESNPPVFIMYQQGSTSLTSTSAILPETTEESNAVGLQVTQHEERLDDFLHTALGSSTSGYSVALMLAGRFTENEVPSLHPFLEDQPPHPATNGSARQLPLTSQREAVVGEPIEALQSFNTTIDMYGFARTASPYAPMDTAAQGLLAHSNKAGAAPASLKSPEADSPWSETQGPPPPYALSPGIYQLRLEAATRPSPVASSPDQETPAPPYALSPGVFRRYGENF